MCTYSHLSMCMFISSFAQSENVSFKDLQNQRVMLPILEYHNKNWTWTDMLMEVKKDYKNAIISQVRIN